MNEEKFSQIAAPKRRWRMWILRAFEGCEMRNFNRSGRKDKQNGKD